MGNQTSNIGRVRQKSLSISGDMCLQRLIISEIWTPILKSSWDTWRSFFPLLNLPSGEAFRRYLYTRSTLAFGEQHVFRPLFLVPFATPMLNKFFDYSSLASWHQYSNSPLRGSIEKFAKKIRNGEVIKTRIDKNEPRLLLVSVDIENAETTIFDSYDTEVYQDGISLKHVIASAAVPKNFAYEEINGRKFWDGGIMSNTPVRELLSQHTVFWKETLGLDSDKERLAYTTWKDWKASKRKIPKIEVCIVNLHPSKEAGSHVPALDDYDMTKDRENDIKLHDKTEYDLKMGNVVNDYKDFVERMTDLAIELIDKINESVNKINEVDYKNDLKGYYDHKTREVNDILNDITRTTRRKGKERRYWHLLKQRFDLDEKIKIQREDDVDTISDKLFDFSYETIDQLIKKGIGDALKKIFEVEKEKNDYSVNKACNELQNMILDIKKENTNEDHYLIEAANHIIRINQ